MKIRLLCFLFLFFCTKIFANEKELPIGTFQGIGFSLEKNGLSILSHENLYFHDSNLKIKKISSNTYELTRSIYLQKTQESKALSDNRVDRYKVIWRSETMGTLVNQHMEYNKELTEFLLLAGSFTIKSLVSKSGVVETQTYKIE